ncbi:MAG: DUF5597 domain-containing protein [Prevotella sp.]|nr:DUF5597 domain-containing protein [Prevotella sp.]
MKKIVFLFIMFCFGNSLFAGQVTFPFPILGGELSNSAATCVDDIDAVMPRMRLLGLNTVLVPAYWEFIEPIEGQFDFTLTDRVIDKARENDLKVIFLWFGAWKNSMSCYTPLWFKTDTKRFPRAMTKMGKPMEIACCFSEDVLQADNKAFGTFMRHLANKDKGTGTVIMIQIENEIGMLEDARDHSPLAEKTYRSQIPKKLWKVLDIRQPRTWLEYFGDDIYGEEKFMAYHYAKYVEQLAQTARSVYDMPLYVNAAMNSRGRQPGQYPSAGPLAHLIDFWHAGAPSIDLLAPDIYDTGFQGWVERYALPNNQLFIPESRCCVNSGVRAMYVFGEHNAIGFSPFAIDQATETETESVTKAYDLIRQLFYLSSHRSWGLLFNQQDKECIINDNQTILTCRHFFTLPWDPRATNGSEWPEGGGILLKLDTNEYLLAGSGIVVSFATTYEKAFEDEKTLGEDGFVIEGEKDQKTNDTNQKSVAKLQKRFSGKRKGIASVDEVRITPNGKLTYLRRENGDQDHQGRHARISCGEWKILHIKLYEY